MSSKISRNSRMNSSKILSQQFRIEYWFCRSRHKKHIFQQYSWFNKVNWSFYNAHMKWVLFCFKLVFWSRLIHEFLFSFFCIDWVLCQSCHICFLLIYVSFFVQMKKNNLWNEEKNLFQSTKKSWRDKENVYEMRWDEKKNIIIFFIIRIIII